MKTVLYTDDFEPITIIDLPAECHDFEKWWAKRGPWINVPVPQKLTWPIPDTYPAGAPCIPIVRIQIEVIRWKDYTYRPLFIVNESNLVRALQLKPDYLPGQLSEVLKMRDQNRFLVRLITDAIMRNKDD